MSLGFLVTLSEGGDGGTQDGGAPDAGPHGDKNNTGLNGGGCGGEGALDRTKGTSQLHSETLWLSSRAESPNPVPPALGDRTPPALKMSTACLGKGEGPGDQGASVFEIRMVPGVQVTIWKRLWCRQVELKRRGTWRAGRICWDCGHHGGPLLLPVGLGLAGVGNLGLEKLGSGLLKGRVSWHSIRAENGHHRIMGHRTPLPAHSKTGPWASQIPATGLRLRFSLGWESGPARPSTRALEPFGIIWAPSHLCCVLSTQNSLPMQRLLSTATARWG